MNSLEKLVYTATPTREITTLSMLSKKLAKQGVSKQRVWNALNLLTARGLLEKVERGVYRRIGKTPLQ